MIDVWDDGRVEELFIGYFAVLCRRRHGSVELFTISNNRSGRRRQR